MRHATDNEQAVRIERIDVHCLSVPLLRPYRLAFGDLTAFDTLLVELTDSDGRHGFGEATLLSGYRVPLLALFNADDEASTEREFESLLEQGYRTVKVKVGLAGVDDAARIRRIQRVVAGRARIRIDANQAFTGAEAAELLAKIDPQDIELFEQPCAASDWAAHAQAARTARVPLMLDESIYDFADIDRAAAEGLAAYAKVKLVKFISIARLGGHRPHPCTRHAARARQRRGLRSRLLDGGLRRRPPHRQRRGDERPAEAAAYAAGEPAARSARRDDLGGRLPARAGPPGRAAADGRDSLRAAPGIRSHHTRRQA